jgi:hypothetical protein
MTQISCFTGEIVPIAQVVTGDGDESAAPELTVVILNEIFKQIYISMIVITNKNLLI